VYDAYFEVGYAGIQNVEIRNGLRLSSLYA